VDVVRACFEAWRRGDFEEALARYSEDAAWINAMDGAVERGPRGVARGMEEWVGAFHDYWLEFDDLVEAGDKVVFLWRQGGIGKASGVRVEDEGAMVFTVREGRITRAEGFSDRAEAFADAGVQPPA
jgi:ketosteroid isomerase-like protein